MGENYSGTNPFAPMKKADQETPDVYGAAEGTNKHEPWDVPDATPFSDPAPQRVDGGAPNAEWVTTEDKPTPDFSNAGDNADEPLAADEDGSNDRVGDEAPTPGDGESGAVEENTVAGEEKGDDSEVPSGTAKEVLDWVGDDEDRARKALDAEEAKGEDARKGLTRDLQAKLEN